MKRSVRNTRRGTVLLMIVGLLAMLFMIVTAYITLARFDRLTFEQAGQGARLEAIIASIQDTLAGQVSRALVDDQGRPHVGGPGYSTIPGGPGSEYLASNEPTRDLRGGTNDFFPEDYRYPGVTGLNGSAGNKRISDLVWDNPRDTDSGGFIRGDNDWFDSLDAVYNARGGFMDADGDGLPDGYFGDGDPNTPGISLLTELANAMGGNVVRTFAVNPAAIPDQASSIARQRWDHFERLARYFASGRVVSHGGMIQVALPLPATGARDYWNRDFLTGMFNWIRHGGDAFDLTDSQADWFRRMWSERQAVEPLLRLRGGMLVGRAGGQTAMPESLADWQKRFADTFLPSYVDKLGRDRNLADWQRFNASLREEWNIWRQAVSIDANTYNEGGFASATPVARWNRRPYLTTANFSDDIARDNGDASVPRYATDGDKLTPGLFPGAPKFFLGKIAYAFDNQGRFYSPDDADTYEGRDVIEELIDYYYELLSAYSGWSDEGVTLREQAIMLAVNTVAFSAPRGRTPFSPALDGFVDNVWYADDGPSGTGKIYYGQTPQPYITQVLAYQDARWNDSTESVDRGPLELAVELFNPHDAYYPNVGSDDEHALPLHQFAFSINDDFEANDYDPSLLRPIAGASAEVPSYLNGRLAGRTFMRVVLLNQAAFEAESYTSFFANLDEGEWGPPEAVIIRDIAVRAADTAGTGIETVTVKLWRRGSHDEWALVDEFEVEEPPEIIVDPTGIDPDEEEPNIPAGSWRDAWRNIDSREYWGEDRENNRARWNCVLSYPWDEDRLVNATDGDGQPINLGDPQRSRVLRVGWPIEEGTAPRATPTVPLWTMNAGARTTLFVHGSARPASFPTPGFLLFVPRFSHWSAPMGLGEARCAGRVLYDHWDKRNGPNNRLDLGHMPLFHNGQDVDSHSGFNVTGRVPWGQLVFDYFTTLNPMDADGDGAWNGRVNPYDRVDIYRIPGRLNINTAPWYILAGVPLIGPNSGNPTASFPLVASGATALTVASPAFWSQESGILAGEDELDRPRFIGTEDNRLLRNAGNTTWWRLGPHLAQAAVAYRDRILVTNHPSVPDELIGAATRNAAYTRRPAQYGSIRGESDDLDATEPVDVARWKRGFLTLGEFANVPGFDGATDQQLANGGVLAEGDFMKAAGFLALLDTHYLTTRSNTFTIYTTLIVNDPESPQASVRAQVTIDRSNLLPRLQMVDLKPFDGLPDRPRLQLGDWDQDEITDAGPIIIQSTGLPERIGERQTAYANTRYDH